MLRKSFVAAALALTVLAVPAFAWAGTGGHYKVSATAIEACSCPLFCACYYNTEPAGGHHCQFNNAYKFDAGSHWGDVDLSGAKIWISGDLGSHYAEGKTEWAVVTFDKAVSPAQREAINGWMGKVFPVEWAKVEVREDEITWQDSKTSAHAKLASGLAEISLEKVFDSHGKQSVVNNTSYWGADSNSGFHLAKSTHYFKGEPSYDYTGRNGFTITITNEGELPAAGAAAGN